MSLQPNSSLETETRNSDISGTDSGYLGTTESNTTASTSSGIDGAKSSDENTTNKEKAPLETNAKDLNFPNILPFKFADAPITDGVYRQLCDACRQSDGSIDGNQFQYMVSVLMDRKPHDPLEMMLINQMTGMHALVMDHVGILRRSDTPGKADIAERILNKLARTFAIQMETLSRYRAIAAEERAAIRSAEAQMKVLCAVYGKSGKTGRTSATAIDSKVDVEGHDNKVARKGRSQQ